MSRPPRWILFALLGAVLLQVGVLAAVYANAVYPLWTGQAIRLKTVPVDPRDLFRGNYARLRYDISTVSLISDREGAPLRHGEIVYVMLSETAEGVHVFAGASLARPRTGVYLRGRIQGDRWGGRSGPPYQVRYGIEAYFTQKQKALDLEARLRDGGVAVVMVAGNGKAALKDVMGPESAY